MRKRIGTCAAVLTIVAGFAAAQQMKPKSKKEIEAIQAVQNAKAPDERIAAVDALVTKFADTEFKSWALQLAADAELRKGDTVKALVYAQNALEADAKNYQAMLLMSGELARGTRENDLDKDEKLAKAEKLANDAIAAANVAVKPNPAIPDSQWADAKKDYVSQGHEDLGLVAMARKKNDVAIAEFKTAVDGAGSPDPVVMARLAAAYNVAGKPDEAIDMASKVLAMPNVSDAVKKFAQTEKTRAETAKNAHK
jgi:tetratricopeptide (TPR) repeat protein